MRQMRSLGLMLGLSLSLGAAAWAGEPGAVVDDGYLTGYIQAVIDHDPAWAGVNVTVRQGVITLQASHLDAGQQARLSQTLQSIRGVKEVTLNPAPGAPVPSAPPAAVVAPPSPAAPAAVSAAAARPALFTIETGPGWEWVPQTRLFDPLLADPRWPHFGASTVSYQDETLQNVATVSFGETIALTRYPAPDFMGGQFDLVLQPGLFAIFDADSDSADLVNADYFIGGGVAWRNNKWSFLLRVFHQSSHLGDEYILNNGLTPADRINFNYEAAHLLVSYDLTEWSRLYAGGGVLFNTFPEDLPIGTVEYGLEARCPYALLNWDNLAATPLLALDVKHWEYADWDGDISLRAGFELSDPRKGRNSSKMQLMFEFFTGHNPHGQFYTQTIRYLGTGLHFYY